MLHAIFLTMCLDAFISDGVEAEADGAELAEVSVCKS